MQSLDIISINIWHIVISLCNLLILYLVLKKFLYQPVKKVLESRQAAIDSRYRDADDAKSEALRSKAQWEERMAAADEEAGVEEVAVARGGTAYPCAAVPVTAAQHTGRTRSRPLRV